MVSVKENHHGNQDAHADSSNDRRRGPRISGVPDLAERPGHWRDAGNPGDLHYTYTRGTRGPMPHTIV